MSVNQGHDGICEYCGACTPCEESDCNEPAGHPYTCEDCLRKERKRPYRSYLDVLDSVTRFGF